MKKVPAYTVGDKIEARFGNGNQWYPGKVVDINEDNTYALKYDDGDLESRVKESLIRLHGHDNSSGSIGSAPVKVLSTSLHAHL